jgi:hypothetical protein
VRHITLARKCGAFHDGEGGEVVGLSEIQSEEEVGDPVPWRKGIVVAPVHGQDSGEGPDPSWMLPRVGLAETKNLKL